MQIGWQDLGALHPTGEPHNTLAMERQSGHGELPGDARAALLAGEPIDLRSPPSCVTVHRWSGPVPGPNQEGHAPACLQSLKGCCDEVTVVITHHNAHALGSQAPRGRQLPRGS